MVRGQPQIKDNLRRPQIGEDLEYKTTLPGKLVKGGYSAIHVCSVAMNLYPNLVGHTLCSVPQHLENQWDQTYI